MGHRCPLLLTFQAMVPALARDCSFSAEIDQFTHWYKVGTVPLREVGDWCLFNRKVSTVSVREVGDWCYWVIFACFVWLVRPCCLGSEDIALSLLRSINSPIGARSVQSPCASLMMGVIQSESQYSLHTRGLWLLLLVIVAWRLYWLSRWITPITNLE